MFEKIFESVNKAGVVGEFCLSGEAYEMPKILGLEVENFGPVCFPLVDPQASNLISVCQQNLFGKNGLTITKTENLCFFELDASKVRISNPEWEPKLGELVKRVGKGLGCANEIEVKIQYFFLFLSF